MGFLIAAAALGITIRNFLAKPSRAGAVWGWISMVAFAGLAAYCFWKGEELRRAIPATPEARAALAQVLLRAQGLMIGSLIGLIVASLGAARQRKGSKPA